MLQKVAAQLAPHTGKLFSHWSTRHLKCRDNHFMFYNTTIDSKGTKENWFSVGLGCSARDWALTFVDPWWLLVIFIKCNRTCKGRCAIVTMAERERIFVESLNLNSPQIFYNHSLRLGLLRLYYFFCLQMP